MKILSIALLSVLFISCTPKEHPLPSKGSVLKKLELANSYFMNKWPNPTLTVTTNKERPSNLWTRAVYYEGLMALYNISPKDEYYNYALDWASFHQWAFRSKDIHNPRIFTRDADNLCAAQTYLNLYLLDPQPERITNTKLCVDSIIKVESNNDWHWIDALQMAMPVFAKLGVIFKDEQYFDKMHKMFLCSRDSIGGGLYNKKDHLWWRDADFVYPYTEPNGEDCYWSRGNGWVYATLVRVLNILPHDCIYRNEYIKMFQDMSEALLKVQREDGFWNVSLHDENNYGGKELSGTALFLYGFAWGINNELLDENKYKKPMQKAWTAMVKDAVHANGFLGYVQGTGKEPKDGQPVTFTSKPDFEDFGLGCFLLGGTEYYKYLLQANYQKAHKSELSQSLENIFYNEDFVSINDAVYMANDYGAIGDEKKNCTKAIQKAIDLAAENGGGIVSFEPGIYMLSSVFVKSNVELNIPEGVVLKAIQDDNLYPIIDTRIAGIEMKWPAALVNVNEQQNVRITGNGIIDGNGEYWWRKYWGNGHHDIGGMRKEYERKGLRWVVDYDCQRVRAVVVYKSDNVHLENFTIKRSGFWTVTLTYCNNVHVDGLIVRNNIGGFGPSSDGIDTDSSVNVLVENCDIDCNDDNFCVKAGKDADGLRVNKPSKNVVYRNSVTRSGHGLFTIGSETSGGMENIEAYNLESVGTSIGIRLKSAKIRGGVMKNIFFHDIVMDDVKRPFQFEMNWNSNYSYPVLPKEFNQQNIPNHWKVMLTKVDPVKGIPEFRDLTFSNIDVSNAEWAFYANAYAEKKMKNFIWQNVNIKANKAGFIKNAADWKMENVTVVADMDTLIIENSDRIEIPEGVVLKCN